MSQLKGESDEAYAKLVADDTQKLIDKLAAIGVTTDIFCIPPLANIPSSARRCSKTRGYQSR